MASDDKGQILDNGMSMPYAAIFDYKGEAIIDPLTDIPVGQLITNFFYEYQEEKEDSCEITIETDNPNIIDLPSLRPNMNLRVQWGHIFPDGSSKSGPVRTVMIRDIDAVYNENGVRYTFKCTDPFAVTKNTYAARREQLFDTWVKNNISGKFGIEIIDYTSRHKVYKKQIENPQDNGRQRNQ